MKLRELLAESQRPEWLDQISSLEQAIELAAQHATELGRGANRVAFKLPNSRVLKLAATSGGLDANVTEIQLLGNNAIKQFRVTVPLVDADTDGSWLITELTKPASEQLFQQVSGGSLTDLMNHVMDVMEPNDDIFADPVPVHTATNVNSQWVQQFKAFCKKVEHITPIGEFADIKNWGELNGAPVIIDLGATYIVHRGLFLDAIKQL